VAAVLSLQAKGTFVNCLTSKSSYPSDGTHALRQLFKHLTLLLGQRFRCNHKQSDQLVATPTSVKMGDSLVFQPKESTCLAARRDFKLALTIESRYFYFGTKSRLSKAHWQLKENTITLPGEEFVLCHR